MRIIINADDLGESQKANDIIFDLITSKLITSATILSNGSYLSDAVDRIIKTEGCSFGAHLNITTDKPLSQNGNLGLIQDENGFFCFKKLVKTKMTKALSLSIYKEFCCQIEALLDRGVQISHIDSHFHIHTLPKIFPILKKTQKKYKINKVRISRNIYDKEISKVLAVKKKFYNFMLKYLPGTKTTSGFTDLLTFCREAENDRIKYDTVEIMVHPQDIAEEIDILRSSWKEKLPFSVDLINYDEL